ncbi:hypothetical protein ACFPRL_33575 [Pseudoclavibacter helvolus]
MRGAGDAVCRPCAIGRARWHRRQRCRRGRRARLGSLGPGGGVTCLHSTPRQFVRRWSSRALRLTECSPRLSDPRETTRNPWVLSRCRGRPESRTQRRIRPVQTPLILRQSSNAREGGRGKLPT